jgi:2,7-dihydroxy-5-methyl-1-naphthoate 7-O-methyltransferase
MAIRVAATLHLADHLAAGATTASRLAPLVNADRDVLERLLRHLAAVGVLDGTDRGEYQLTNLGRELQDDHPSGIRAWLDLEQAIGRADLAFMRLLDTVRNGEPAYPAVFGKGFWADLDADPALSASFDTLMGPQPLLADVVGGYHWSTARQVVDVGGGDGTLLAAILRAHPHLRGTLVERPGPAAAAARAFAGAGVQDRCSVAPGSFFDPLPPGGDVYVLCRVLNDWDDQHAVAILRGCGQAAGSSGKVLVLEEGHALAGADDAVSTDMDLRMLVYFGGRERSLSDLAALAAAAGLQVSWSRMASQCSLVELSRGRG